MIIFLFFKQLVYPSLFQKDRNTQKLKNKKEITNENVYNGQFGEFDYQKPLFSQKTLEDEKKRAKKVCFPFKKLSDLNRYQ